MAKKESLKEEALKEEAFFKPKAIGFSGRIFGIVKFVLGVCLLPFVYALSVAFFNEAKVLEKTISNSFFAGSITFIVVYLFVYEPVIIYNQGHKILEKVFSFFKPLVRVAPYVLPIYTIILLLICLLYSAVSKSTESLTYFVFLFGFSLTLHLVFSARSLRSRQSDFLKGNYIFGFSFVYILNLTILALGLSLLFNKYSFVNFCNNSFQIAAGVFKALFGQLFLP